MGQKLMFSFIKPIKRVIVIPQQVLGLFIMSVHVATCYLLHAASGQAIKPNNPKLLSVGSDMSSFGSLLSIEQSSTEI